jgi:flagellar hook-associated protein 1 FlgK
MGSLFGGLASAAETLRVFERGLITSQNNVSNASTPGFVKQTQPFEAKRFDPGAGIPGGVRPGDQISARSSFAEEAVWRQQQKFGQFNQRRSDLESIEPIYSIGAGSGIGGALNNFFATFSQLSVTPNDTASRQLAIDRATTLANQINQTASGLGTARSNTDRQLRSVTSEINALGERLVAINRDRRTSFSEVREPGSDAVLYQTLEELASLVDFTAIENDDGTLTVFLGGQSLFVIGDRQYAISVDINASAQLRDAQGNDITSQLSSGRLASMVDFRNTQIPAYEAELNTLAAAVADQVNGQLALGVDQNGFPPTQNLFDYDPLAGAAGTLRVNNLVPSDLALADPSAPGGNGNAIALAQLSDQPVVGGLSLTAYYGQLSSKVGRALESSRQSEDVHTQLLSQARVFREGVSGVSLDEEAALMIQYQRAYEAAAQLFRVLNEMTETLLSVAAR